MSIDYNGSFDHWQRQLDAANIKVDITELCGCTYSEINNAVNAILKQKKEGRIPDDII